VEHFSGEAKHNVQKPTFERASLRYSPFVLIGCYFCLSEVRLMFVSRKLQAI